jgi:hypothetical protein
MRFPDTRNSFIQVDRFLRHTAHLDQTNIYNTHDQSKIGLFSAGMNSSLADVPQRYKIDHADGIGCDAGTSPLFAPD